MAGLSEAIEQAYERSAANQVQPDGNYFFTVRAAHEHLINMMDQVAAGLATEGSPELIEDLNTLATAAPGEPAPSPFDEEFTDDLEEIDRSLNDDMGLSSDTEDTEEQPPLAETDEEMDEELAAIFLEEARDLIDSTAESLHSWSESTGSTDLLRLLQRDLHTLKGGARLADIPAVGDLSHELENLFEGLTENRLSVT